MRRTLVILAALFLAATPVAAAPPNVTIDVSADVVTLGADVPYTFAYDKKLRQNESLWVFEECLANGSIALRFWTQAGGTVRTGTTASWDGTTPAACTLNLQTFQAVPTYKETIVASDTFTLAP